MYNIDDTELYTYYQIDWSKPSSALKLKECKLTEYEAHELNKGLALNGFTLRWIKK
jgi:hypothetical protein